VPPVLSGSASQFAARQRNTAQPFEPWWIASYSALTYGAASQGDTALEHNLLEEQASALSILKTLHPQQSEVVKLRIGSELSFEQISQITGLGLSAVKMTYYRAIERLRLM
jgi:DNA-directed RNA polymerase specialized sigma24 family protein